MRNNATTRQEVEASLQRLSELVSARDMAVLDEFVADPDVMLLGSEAGEFKVGREQLAAHFQEIFKLPFSIAFDWTETRVSSIDDVAWVYASGDIVLKGADGEMRAPYRLTGVLERRDGRWRWRQFHGSEPTKPQ